MAITLARSHTLDQLSGAQNIVAELATSGPV